MDDGEPTAVTETSGPAVPGLSERDSRVLRFEQRAWRYPAAKDEAIRAEFGLSPARYYQLLNALIESPAALAAEPMLVGRLSRLRAARRQGWSPAAPAPASATNSFQADDRA
ncbi:DUF3263 domain-containing protein [Pseudofrankia asymbiotica]|uniref:DUF3263 domain-containing protein n=1 Tax=Pseudofrankia asymbiotica TaxID=1834516 RepID=A0A1V2I3T7_9ACTN|nr:DUF3263 domain-containing protein [Pseudofrankia asymbiotica]ONH23730.1 hypothetical protein BL253_32170 [Pseudofrankia asymbiotica]